MIEIKSLTNDKVKNWVRLSNKATRKNKGIYLVEGENLVKEALSLNLVEEVITTKDDYGFSNTYLVSEEIMKKISNLVNPPKVMASVRIINNDEIKGNVVILDKLQDPGNLGTIIRSAVAFNVGTIVLSDDSVDVYNNKVIRASEGMIFKVNIVTGDLIKIINQLKSNDYVIYSTDVVSGEEVSKVNTKYAVIIGNEGSGVSLDVKKTADKFLYIKMNEECESLNAGVAASIIMYEMNKE